MITDIFIFLITSFLSMVLYLLSLFNFAIPTSFQTYLNQFVQQVNYFNGVVPVDTLLQATATLLTFFSFYYSIKIILWAIAHLPWFGKEVKHPAVSMRPGKN